MGRAELPEYAHTPLIDDMKLQLQKIHQEIQVANTEFYNLLLANASTDSEKRIVESLEDRMTLLEAYILETDGGGERVQAVERAVGRSEKTRAGRRSENNLSCPLSMASRTSERRSKMQIA